MQCSNTHKELRFAISLPFSASSAAKNGRLSATFIRHAPAPFDHAPTDTLPLREWRAPELNRDTNTLNVELAHQALYEDPVDDTDEDLSKVPEDYGRSKNTKKLNLQLKERWTR